MNEINLIARGATKNHFPAGDAYEIVLILGNGVENQFGLGSWEVNGSDTLILNPEQGGGYLVHGSIASSTPEVSGAGLYADHPGPGGWGVAGGALTVPAMAPVGEVFAFSCISCDVDPTWQSPNTTKYKSLYSRTRWEIVCMTSEIVVGTPVPVTVDGAAFYDIPLSVVTEGDPVAFNTSYQWSTGTVFGGSTSNVTLRLPAGGSATVIVQVQNYGYEGVLGCFAQAQKNVVAPAGDEDDGGGEEEPEGFWYCIDGTCVFIEGAGEQINGVAGYATQLSCEAAGCVADNAPDCDLSGTLEIQDLGETHYRAVANLSSESATVVFLRNGVSLTSEVGASLPSALFDVPLGETVRIVAVATDGDNCDLALWVDFKNSDEDESEPGEDGPNTDPSGCCLPGFYRAVAGGPCIPVPSATGPVAGAPATPAVPVVARNCATQALSVTAPAFPASATAIEIQREGTTAAAHTFTAAGSFNDPVGDLEPHRYRARACNGFGCSTWSAYSAPLALASLTAPTWIAPVEGSQASGIVTLIATAGPRASLHASAPLTMKVFGAPLDVKYHAATNQFSTTWDTNMAYQGEVQVTVQARDVAGCYSVPVSRTLLLDNSLSVVTEWKTEIISPDLSAEIEFRSQAISRVGYAAKILRDGGPDAQRYHRFYVVSPNPGPISLAQLGDNTYMRNLVANWQTLRVNDVTPLVTPASAASPQSPDHTARMVMEVLPTETLNLYALGAGNALKIRQTQADEIEILTSTKWLKFTKDGLETLATFADYDISGTVIDGARIGNIIYLARQNSRRIAVINTATEKRTGTLYPWDEERNCKRVEIWKDTLLAIYSTADAATGYVLENGGSFDDPFTLGTSVLETWTSGGAVVLACGDNALRILSASGELSTQFTHTAPVTAWARFEAEGEDAAIDFGAGNGAAFTRSGDTSLALAAIPGGPLADFARFKGASPTLRRALVVGSGVNASKIFLQNLQNGALYEPRWNLTDLQGNLAVKNVALARMLLTLREPSGNPLLGGDAGLFFESMFDLFETSQGVFLARIQEADVDPLQVLKARAVNDQVFKCVRVKTI